MDELFCLCFLGPCPYQTPPSFLLCPSPPLFYFPLYGRKGADSSTFHNLPGSASLTLRGEGDSPAAQGFGVPASGCLSEAELNLIMYPGLDSSSAGSPQGSGDTGPRGTPAWEAGGGKRGQKCDLNIGCSSQSAGPGTQTGRRSHHFSFVPVSIVLTPQEGIKNDFSGDFGI